MTLQDFKTLSKVNWQSPAVTADTAAAFGDAMGAGGLRGYFLHIPILQRIKFISNNPGVVAGATAGALAFTGLSPAGWVRGVIAELRLGF